MKFSCLPAFAFGLDGDSVAMLQQQGQRSTPTRKQLDLLQEGAKFGSLTDELITKQLSQMSAAVSAAQAGEGPDAEALMKLFETLSAEIETFLTQESNDDQKTFDAEREKHNLCISHHNLRTGATGDVAVIEKVLDETKAKHKSCRKAEKAWEDLRSGYECGHAGTVSAALFTVPKCPDICVLKEAFDTDSKAYHDLTPSGMRTSCSEEQILYEDKFCEYRAAKSGTCDGLSQCVEMIDLASMKILMAEHADRRREHLSEVEWLGCRLAQMGGDNSTDCKKEINASKYVLTLDVPSLPECLTESFSVFPQDEDCQAWRQQEYNWQEQEHIKPSKCEAVCQVAESTEIAKGCTDASDVCDFYNHHPGACGKYDNPSFNASEACCKCGKAGTTTTTTPAGPPPGCGESLAGGGWEIVRHVPDGKYWHKATDQLNGVDVYGDPSDGAAAASEWSVQFNNKNFNEFLFATGDCQVWLVAKKDAVYGHYSNEDRQIESSSSNAQPYTAKWFRRDGHPEDPWITTADHFDVRRNGGALYAGNRYGYDGGSQGKGGHNVFIRQN